MNTDEMMVVVLIVVATVLSLVPAVVYFWWATARDLEQDRRHEYRVEPWAGCPEHLAPRRPIHRRPLPAYFTRRGSYGRAGR